VAISHGKSDLSPEAARLSGCHPLAQLRDSGVINEADFEAKTDELLSRI